MKIDIGNKVREHLEAIEKVEELLDSERTKIEIINLYKRFYNKAKPFLESPWEYDFFIVKEIEGNEVKLLTTMPIPYHVGYELISDKINQIGMRTEVAYYMEESVILSGVKFTITDYVVAILPEEEVVLLDSLGKLEVTSQREYIETSIVCPI